MDPGVALGKSSKNWTVGGESPKKKPATHWTVPRGVKRPGIGQDFEFLLS